MYACPHTRQQSTHMTIVSSLSQYGHFSETARQPSPEREREGDRGERERERDTVIYIQCIYIYICLQYISICIYIYLVISLKELSMSTKCATCHAVLQTIPKPAFALYSQSSKVHDSPRLPRSLAFATRC